VCNDSLEMEYVSNVFTKGNFYQSGRSELDKTDAFHFKVRVQSLTTDILTSNSKDNLQFECVYREYILTF